ncbi:MAG TPA: DUF5132 domain-containing protein [Oligoflexus sp.]|uniref:DUF5132 domain-containing protein n=1 Tax=Oligoflexus sp. TaxID=1971216 RepID=UPI002D53520E|nr:DUF5132 domain-containing protein [Oligoflexus sp.]HYX32716.1 DUF5132 domain-containing protein [Oligoflexus sp.]
MFNLSKFSTGFVLGFGAGFISRDLLANGSSVMKPVMKGFMKAGVTVMEKTRESVVEFTETLEDLLAEVRSEHFANQAPKRSPVKRSTTTATAESPKHVKTTATSKS